MSAWQALDATQQAKLQQLRDLLHEVASDPMLGEAAAEAWHDRPVTIHETMTHMRRFRALAVELHGLPEKVTA